MTTSRYDAIANIGVVCAVFRLKRSVTPHFWVNIVDERFEVPGIVEARAAGEARLAMSEHVRAAGEIVAGQLEKD